MLQCHPLSTRYSTTFSKRYSVTPPLQTQQSYSHLLTLQCHPPLQTLQCYPLLQMLQCHPLLQTLQYYPLLQTLQCHPHQMLQCQIVQSINHVVISVLRHLGGMTGSRRCRSASADSGDECSSEGFKNCTGDNIPERILVGLKENQYYLFDNSDNVEVVVSAKKTDFGTIAAHGLVAPATLPSLCVTGRTM